LAPVVAVDPQAASIKEPSPKQRPPTLTGCFMNDQHLASFEPHL